MPEITYDCRITDNFVSSFPFLLYVAFSLIEGKKKSIESKLDIGRLMLWCEGEQIEASVLSWFVTLIHICTRRILEAWWLRTLALGLQGEDLQS